jgi:hypothetical protein
MGTAATRLGSAEPARRALDPRGPQGDGAAALAPGLARIQKRGRAAYAAAKDDPSTENLHELRKRTKDRRSSRSAAAGCSARR